jgi:hypothetical protein
MGIAIFTKSRLIPRRDAIYRVRLKQNRGRLSNQIAAASNKIASGKQTKSRPPIKYERGKSWKHGRDNPYCGRDKSHCGRDKSHCGRDKSRPYNAANGATARSKMPLT